MYHLSKRNACVTYKHSTDVTTCMNKADDEMRWLNKEIFIAIRCSSTSDISNYFQNCQLGVNISSIGSDVYMRMTSTWIHLYRVSQKKRAQKTTDKYGAV